jgi:GH25 family lysozyme M1 (1,4-beta-N-acetylmuramidase)
MAEIYGIDVSKYQWTVDWEKVKAAGKSFAFVRLGWAGYDGPIAGNGGIDSMFAANAKGAKAAGLHVGAYVYSYCKTAEAARIAAQEAIQLAKQAGIDYPIAFDIEDKQYQTMGRTLNTSITVAFLNEVAAAGLAPLLYTYKAFADAYLDMAQISADVWIAQYADKCTYSGPYTIWQHSGSGKCDGVAGACDLDVAYKDYAVAVAEAPQESDCQQLAEQLAAAQAALAQAIAERDMAQARAEAAESEVERLAETGGRYAKIKAIVEG